jgi:hypothetical protein
MPRQNGESRRELTPTAAANQIPAIKKISSQSTAAATVAKAVRYTASANSSYDLLVVERCPACSYSHSHRAFETSASTFERAPHCAPHTTYVVVVDRVVPAAPPLRARRGGAA